MYNLTTLMCIGFYCFHKFKNITYSLVETGSHIPLTVTLVVTLFTVTVAAWGFSEGSQVWMFKNTPYSLTGTGSHISPAVTLIMTRAVYCNYFSLGLFLGSGGFPPPAPLPASPPSTSSPPHPYPLPITILKAYLLVLTPFSFLYPREESIRSRIHWKKRS